MKCTRECTKVFFCMPSELEQIEFSKREYEVIAKFNWKRFKSDRTLHVDSVNELLEGKLHDLVKLKEGDTCKMNTEITSQKITWEQEVNRRRRLVASALQQQSHRNIAEVCRFTGCSFDMVKRVANDLDFCGEVAEFRYPNTKTDQQMAALTRSIEQVNGSFSTIADIKRSHPDFSRRYIARQLKATGLRYILVRKNELRPKQPQYNDIQVLRTVRHLSQSLTNDKVITLYLDEVHFPLYQTSTRHWTKQNFDGHDLHYNRRIVLGVEKLSVIAMCSVHGFVAVQVFQREVRGEDFLYFLQQSLVNVPPGKQVTILADNATWHRAEIVTKTKAGKSMEFNAPGLFKANLIELAFSFVRAEFRKRKQVETVEEEARLLLSIFFDDRNRKRFAGIARYHVRSLLKLLHDHFGAIFSRQRRTTRSTKCKLKR